MTVSFVETIYVVLETDGIVNINIQLSGPLVNSSEIDIGISFDAIDGEAVGKMQLLDDPRY